MMYIEIDDLVGNAFIAYLDLTGNRLLSMKKINEYANKVITDLIEQGEEACLRLSRDRTYKFFYDYSDWFTLVENRNENFVTLNSEISKEQLIMKFSGYLSIPVLVAFRNKKNIR